MGKKLLFFMGLALGIVIIGLSSISVMNKYNKLIPKKDYKSVKIYKTTDFKITKDELIREVNDKAVIEEIIKHLNSAEKIQGVVDITAPEYILNLQQETSMDIFLWLGYEKSRGMLMFPDASGTAYRLNVEAAVSLRRILFVVKTYVSPEGWSINYSPSWDNIQESYIQERATGKTIQFYTINITENDLRKYIENEIKRKLRANEASNTLKDSLTESKRNKLKVFSYSIVSKMDGAEHLLKTTIFFDGTKAYEFQASIPKLTEKEYSSIINSFKVLNK